jgi:murein DD-endopeptidase MepM/ murein hydrolase activator NlpD
MRSTTPPEFQQRLAAYGTILDRARPRVRVPQPEGRTRRIMATAITATLGVVTLALTQILPNPSKPSLVASEPVDQRMVFPIDGPVTFIDSFGATRRDVEGTSYIDQNVDLFARAGTRVLALRAGRISQLNETPRLGNHVWITDDDGNRYLYAHLQKSTSLREGQVVKAGQVIGRIARRGSDTAPSHLSLGIHLPLAMAVNPFPIIQTVRTGSIAPSYSPSSTVVVRLRTVASGDGKSIITGIEGDGASPSVGPGQSQLNVVMPAAAPITALIDPSRNIPPFRASTYVWTTSATLWSERLRHLPPASREMRAARADPDNKQLAVAGQRRELHRQRQAHHNVQPDLSVAHRQGRLNDPSNEEQLRSCRSEQAIRVVLVRRSQCH